MTWVDRFGNVQLAAAAEDLVAVVARPGPASMVAARSQLLAVRVGGARTGAPAPATPGASTAHLARVVSTYADLAEGELGILVDSCGCLALSLNGANAASSLGAHERDHVSICLHLR